MISPNWLFAQVDVTKRNAGIFCKQFYDVVPGRGLLSSSASSSRGDPTHKERFPGIDLGLDGLLEVVFGELGAGIFGVGHKK